jgi:hypothetical protein
MVSGQALDVRPGRSAIMTSIRLCALFGAVPRQV